MDFSGIGFRAARRVSVIVSSSGRPECLAFLWKRLCRQTLSPHRVVFSVSRPEDLPTFWHGHDAAAKMPEIVISPKGLPCQRNRGLESVLDDSDILVFLDDDYVPSVMALEGVARAFEVFPDVTGLTGKLLADGILGPGIDLETAAGIVDEWDAIAGPGAAGTAPSEIAPRPGLYGCNMAFRAAVIGDVRFDERLPLYGWQEDIDFAVRVPGRKIETDAFVGLHCGIKRGRERGQLLGYSQIANPVYLYRKGSINRRFALKLCLRNLVSNHVLALWSEPWIDRRGRLRGNWQAIYDLCRGRSDPQKILILQ